MSHTTSHGAAAVVGTLSEPEPAASASDARSSIWSGTATPARSWPSSQPPALARPALERQSPWAGFWEFHQTQRDFVRPGAVGSVQDHYRGFRRNSSCTRLTVFLGCLETGTGCSSSLGNSAPTHVGALPPGWLRLDSRPRAPSEAGFIFEKNFSSASKRNGPDFGRVLTNLMESNKYSIKRSTSE